MSVAQLLLLHTPHSALRITAFPSRVILGKVPASTFALHPISLPRAVNDSLQALIFGGRMTQSGRQRQFVVQFPANVGIWQVSTGAARGARLLSGNETVNLRKKRAFAMVPDKRFYRF
jgi:hypothetical protein